MKTITFDETKWRLVPLVALEEMQRAADKFGYFPNKYKAAINAAPEHPSQPVSSDICQACHGSGEGSVLSGGGPDAYDVACPCQSCGGSGIVPQAPAERAPLTEDQRGNLVIEHLGLSALTGGKMSPLDAFDLGLDAAEVAHGIKGRP